MDWRAVLGCIVQMSANFRLNHRVSPGSGTALDLLTSASRQHNTADGFFMSSRTTTQLKGSLALAGGFIRRKLKRTDPITIQASLQLVKVASIMGA
jgi:hypothetical protein